MRLVCLIMQVITIHLKNYETQFDSRISFPRIQVFRRGLPKVSIQTRLSQRNYNLQDFLQVPKTPLGPGNGRRPSTQAKLLLSSSRSSCNMQICAFLCNKSIVMKLLFLVFLHCWCFFFVWRPMRECYKRLSVDTFNWCRFDTSISLFWST